MFSSKAVERQANDRELSMSRFGDGSTRSTRRNAMPAKFVLTAVIVFIAPALYGQLGAVPSGDAPRSAQELAFDESPPPIMVEAVRFTLKDKSKVEGLPVREDDESEFVSVIDRLERIPKSKIESREVIRVPSLSVELPNATLNRRLQKGDPSTAAEWLSLARDAEYLGLYSKSLQFLENARAADEELASDAALLQYTAKITAGAQDEHLDRIERSPRNNLAQIAEVFALCDRFEKRWPESPMRDRLSKVREILRESQLKIRIHSVRTNLFSYAKVYCQKVATSASSDLEAAMAMVRSECLPEVFRQLGKLKDVGVDDVEEVYRLWKMRGAISAQSYGYGSGTFIVTPSAKSMPPSPEEWWRNAKLAERIEFLMAYLGEKGVFDERRDWVEMSSYEKACSHPGCGGRGFIEQLDPRTGRTKRSDCPRCKGLGADRWVKLK